MDALENRRARLAVPLMTPEPEPFAPEGVRGFLHRPAAEAPAAIVLAHGASSNANAPLLVAVCGFFAAAGWLALRIDLPFRQSRAGGPPSPSTAGRDRDGLRGAVEAIRAQGVKRIVLGGHSYGGRQSTMLAAEDPAVANALLLLSYPLHAPGKAQLRTAHLPDLRTPCVFVHGERDPFGSIAEMRDALKLIPAGTRLIEVPKAGHELKNPPLEQIEAAVRSALG